MKKTIRYTFSMQDIIKALGDHYDLPPGTRISFPWTTDDHAAECEVEIEEVTTGKPQQFVRIKLTDPDACFIPCEPDTVVNAKLYTRRGDHTIYQIEAPGREYDGFLVGAAVLESGAAEIVG